MAGSMLMVSEKPDRCTQHALQAGTWLELAVFSSSIDETSQRCNSSTEEAQTVPCYDEKSLSVLFEYAWRTATWRRDNVWIMPCRNSECCKMMDKWTHDPISDGLRAGQIPNIASMHMYSVFMAPHRNLGFFCIGSTYVSHRQGQRSDLQILGSTPHRSPPA
jgi:hypothetical protein